MSWDELRGLAQTHVVGCHTATHLRIRSDVSEEVLFREIAESKALLEERLGRPVEAFCWVGGPGHKYTREAALAIRQAGYRYAFMQNSCPVTPRSNPLQLQRTNIEAEWPLDIAAFQVSGAMDLLFTAKRRRAIRNMA
jgi:peptidoglycan/xylan/chitin deacetylase (PgdA/CDA1 family)